MPLDYPPARTDHFVRKKVYIPLTISSLFLLAIIEPLGCSFFFYRKRIPKSGAFLQALPMPFPTHTILAFSFFALVHKHKHVDSKARHAALCRMNTFFKGTTRPWNKTKGDFPKEYFAFKLKSPYSLTFACMWDMSFQKLWCKYICVMYVAHPSNACSLKNICGISILNKTNLYLYHRHLHLLSFGNLIIILDCS